MQSTCSALLVKASELLDAVRVDHANRVQISVRLVVIKSIADHEAGVVVVVVVRIIQ